jgi:predicted HAD superfamily hydrolase
MYTNIPTDELKNIIEATLHNNSICTESIQEIITIYELIVKQNYFTHNEQFLQQTSGLAMGAQSSAI